MVLKIHKQKDKKTLEDIVIEQLSEEVSKTYVNEGLSKEVIKLSQYLDKYIVTEQKIRRNEYHNYRKGELNELCYKTI